MLALLNEERAERSKKAEEEKAKRIKLGLEKDYSLLARQSLLNFRNGPNSKSVSEAIAEKFQKSKDSVLSELTYAESSPLHYVRWNSPDKQAYEWSHYNSDFDKEDWVGKSDSALALMASMSGTKPIKPLGEILSMWLNKKAELVNAITALAKQNGFKTILNSDDEYGISIEFKDKGIKAYRGESRIMGEISAYLPKDADGISISCNHEASLERCRKFIVGLMQMLVPEASWEAIEKEEIYPQLTKVLPKHWGGTAGELGGMMGDKYFFDGPVNSFRSPRLVSWGSISVKGPQYSGTQYDFDREEISIGATVKFSE